jgi:hypothetical protein
MMSKTTWQLSPGPMNTLGITAEKSRGCGKLMKCLCAEDLGTVPPVHTKVLEEYGI